MGKATSATARAINNYITDKINDYLVSHFEKQYEKESLCKDKCREPEDPRGWGYLSPSFCQHIVREDLFCVKSTEEKTRKEIKKKGEPRVSSPSLRKLRKVAQKVQI